MQHEHSVGRRVIAKACDACRRRKTRCSGQQPCPNCRSAKLACTYDAPRGQGGNRGVRATVLNELRALHTQHDTQPSCDDVLPVPLTCGTLPDTKKSCFDRQEAHACIRLYMTHIHHVVPLLSETTLQTEVNRAETSLLSLQLVLAFRAYVASFGQFHGAEGADCPLRDAKSSLHTALAVQNTVRTSMPQPHSVYISFFLYGAFAGQGDYLQAWFYLREATTLYMMLKVENHEWFDEEAQAYLFWILVVSERQVQFHSTYKRR